MRTHALWLGGQGLWWRRHAHATPFLHA